MDLYSRKQRWKLVLAVVAMLMVGASLYYSSRIVEGIREEERLKVRLWAEAVQNRAELVNYTEDLFDRLRQEERKKVELLGEAQRRLVSDDGTDFSFYLKVVSDNTTVPVIITNGKGEVLFKRNLQEGIENDKEKLRTQIQQMAADFPVTELWQVITGQAAGRRSETHITVFDSVGFATEDFSALRYLRDMVQGTRFYTELDLTTEPEDPRNLYGMFRQPAASALGSAA